MFKVQILPKPGYTGWMVHPEVVQQIQNDLQSGRPGSAASRMRQAGVKLVAVSSTTATNPFAED
jgi:hypothetical protein